MHATVDYEAGEDVAWRWEIRQVGGSTWSPTAWTDPAPFPSGGTTDLPYTFTGLNPDTAYQYRLCGYRTAPGEPRGSAQEPICFDRDRDDPDESNDDENWSQFVTDASSGCIVELDELKVSGCTTVKSDTAAYVDDANAADEQVIDRWGAIECENNTRVTSVGPSGNDSGDDHPKADGSSQGNLGYRRLTVKQGDNTFGERCEIGRNNRIATPSTFQVYNSGDRMITFLSYRLPDSLNIAEDEQKAVWQMKQSEPSSITGGVPVLSMHARDGHWTLRQANGPMAEPTVPPDDDYSVSKEIWRTPAQKNVWTRMAIDVKYSTNPSVGFIRVYIDLNQDGDALDPGEQSGMVGDDNNNGWPDANPHTFTLKIEPSGTASDGLAEGDPVPSQLRAGIYHDECPSVNPGCPVHLDNVQVVDP